MMFAAHLTKSKGRNGIVFILTLQGDEENILEIN